MANRKTQKKKAKKQGQTLLTWDELVKLGKEKRK